MSSISLFTWNYVSCQAAGLFTSSVRLKRDKTSISCLNHHILAIGKLHLAAIYAERRLFHSSGFCNIPKERIIDKLDDKFIGPRRKKLVQSSRQAKAILKNPRRASDCSLKSLSRASKKTDELTKSKQITRRPKLPVSKARIDTGHKIIVNCLANPLGSPLKDTIAKEKIVITGRLNPFDFPLIPVATANEREKIPTLQHGLDRVLFNPGVFYLQDPRSRVFNFDPYLQTIMPIQDFDFDALHEYVTSSRDHVSTLNHI